MCGAVGPSVVEGKGARARMSWNCRGVYPPDKRDELHAVELPSDSPLKEWFTIISEHNSIALLGIVMEYAERHSMTTLELHKTFQAGLALNARDGESDATFRNIS